MANIQLLLRQHVGAPCAPVVKVGDEVKKGTLVAEPTGLGANIFSSVYGKVVEITEDRIIIEPAAEQSAEYVKIAKSENKLDMI
ncbi:MAG: proline reductase-associated electron transfer protein PrdC, partial [Oscillospiraceae bacterium]|nr:proline reductase-associated electron transfer protein PrdC [Oscillospiraceae bacterium]